MALLLLLLAQSEAVFKALDSGDRAALEKIKPEKLVKIIRAGRPGRTGKAGDQTLQITDGYGTATDLVLKVPAGGKPAGVMLLLHGRGGDGPRMMASSSFVKFAADRNYILAAPTAQKLSKEAEGEDGGSEDAHWWCFKPGSSIFAALREIRRRYVVDDNRIIVTGYSMGGFGAQGTGFRYPDRFSAMVAFAGGLSRVEYGLTTGDPRLRPIVENGRMLPVYLLHGDRDETVPPTFDRLTRDQLKGFGAPHVYVEVPGAAHGLDTSERGTLHGPLVKWLEARTRDPHPKKVTFVSVGDYSAACYWVRIDGKPGARVEAQIKPKNTIEVTATDVKTLTLFLDDELLDLGKPVIVTSGGRELFNGKVDDGLDAVLESWKDREDAHLLYRAKVTVEFP